MVRSVLEVDLYLETKVIEGKITGVKELDGQTKQECPHQTAG